MVQKSIKVDFARQSYKSKSLPLSSQRLVNLYAETAPVDAKNQLALFSTPGLTVKYDLGVDNPVWGMQVMGNNLYAVCGLDVYKIDSGGNITNIGSINNSSGRVYMSHNGTQLTITTLSGEGFIATSSGVTQITDPAYQLASSSTYIDGYTAFSRLNSDQFFISAQFNSSSFDALDFATAEWEPDELVATFTFNGQLWLFGTDTIEIYENTGAADFPFQRYRSATLEKGCVAKFSIAKHANNLIWLSEEKKFYKAAGYNFEDITTFPIHQEIERYVVVDDAFAFIYVQDGHEIYCCTFPTENKTWCYDLSTGLWHERESLKINSPTHTRWRANAYSEFKGIDLVGDFESGKIFQLNPDVFTEDGRTLISEATSQIYFDNTNRAIISRLNLDTEPGVGTTSGQGSDPEIMMQFSKDGGFTYSSELWRNLGKKGKYLNRVVWRKLGTARSIIFKIKISDPVKRVVLGAYIDVDIEEP
jgi:hypothetical protein